MSNFRSFSDDELFKMPGELPGSEASYWRDIEIRRRQFVRDTAVADAQIEAARAQIEATQSAKDTAWWTKVSAICVAVTVAIMAASLFVQMYLARPA